MNTIIIKRSDLSKLPAAIREDAATMAMINTILTTYTKLESLYGFDLVLEAAPAAPTPTEPTAGHSAPTAKLMIKGVSGTDLLFRLELSDDWPIKQGEAHRFVGELMLQPAQMAKAVSVDDVSTDNAHAGRKTLSNAFGGGSHSLNVKHGETVKAWIRQGKLASNVEEFAWPLGDT